MAADDPLPSADFRRVSSCAESPALRKRNRYREWNFAKRPIERTRQSAEHSAKSQIPVVHLLEPRPLQLPPCPRGTCPATPWPAALPLPILLLGHVHVALLVAALGVMVSWFFSIGRRHLGHRHPVGLSPRHTASRSSVCTLERARHVSHPN
jgi:hypothetical protein